MLPCCVSSFIGQALTGYSNMLAGFLQLPLKSHHRKVIEHLVPPVTTHL
jgi:hypothetical protein